MAEQLLLEEQRENWGSRAGFVLAAIGSAVGLGNLWGFPYKLYKYGGGAFLIPYIVAMLIIGIPVLILEFSLGHMTQRAAPDAFRRLGRKKEPLGWWGIVLGFVIITYYPVILAWCLSFLGFCIQGAIHHGGELPWAATKEGCQTLFLNDYCNIWGGGQSRSWLLGSFSPDVVFALAAVWILMFLCIFKGVRIVSKVVLWTVPLPWLMLVILMVRALTLDGATHGMAYYLNPDWSQLLRPTTWRFAFGQVFFSMSLAFGVMVTYASFLHRKSDINNNAMIVGLGDLGTSFVAGIAVFATLGAMSLSTLGTAHPETVSTVVGESGTVGMAFMAFPYALGQLPYSAYFGIVFFVALLTLGIDSAFSITESVLASVIDKTGWKRTPTLWGITFVGFVSGLVYCSRGGLTWLENIDGFINGPWGIALLGMMECVVLGWMYRISRLRQHANERSDWKLGAWWDWNIRVTVPVLLSALFVWSLYDTVTAPGGYLVDTEGKLIVPTLVGVILAGAAPLLAVLLSLKRSPLGGLGVDDAEPAEAPAPAAGGCAGGALLAVVGMGGGIYAAYLTIAAKLADNAGRAIDTVMPVFFDGHVPMVYLILAASGAAAIAATVLSIRAATARERLDADITAGTRVAGAMGTLATGVCIGMVLALWSLLGRIKSKPVKEQTDLSTAAYVIMGIMSGIIIIGLGWCFIRAIKAAAEKANNQDQAAEI